MGRWSSFSFCLIALILIVIPRTGAADKPIASPVPHGTVTLISESQSLAPGRALELGVRFQLEKGWHIYWLNPGDSGQPPRIDWHLPAGITAGEMEWPAPQRIGDANIVDFGYTDAVTLLVPMHASPGLKTAQTATIRGDLRVLVCREICVQGKAALLLSIPVKANVEEPDQQTRELFAAARKSLPRAAPPGWTFRVTGSQDNFVLHANLGRQTKQATFFPVAESQIDNAAPQTITPSARGFEMTLKKSDQLLKPIAQLKGVLVLAPDEAFLIDAPVAKSSAAK
jgi:thiol:disulfide interchange protein DsbD